MPQSMRHGFLILIKKGARSPFTYRRVGKADTFKEKTRYARILFDSRAYDVAPNFARVAFLTKSYTRGVVAPLFSPNMRLAKSSKMLKRLAKNASRFFFMNYAKSLGVLLSKITGRISNA